MCVGLVVGPESRPSASRRRQTNRNSRQSRRRRRINLKKKASGKFKISRLQHHHSQSALVKRGHLIPKKKQETGTDRKNRSIVGGKRSSIRRRSAVRSDADQPVRRVSGAPASGSLASDMAPALTQATPHQRCCPVVGNGSSSPAAPIALIHRHHHPAVAPTSRPRRHSGVVTGVKKASTTVQEKVGQTSSDCPVSPASSSISDWTDGPSAKSRARKCSGARSSVGERPNVTEPSCSLKTRLRHNSSHFPDHNHLNRSTTSNHKNRPNDTTSSESVSKLTEDNKTVEDSVSNNKEIAQSEDSDLGRGGGEGSGGSRSDEKNSLGDTSSSVVDQHPGIGSNELDPPTGAEVSSKEVTKVKPKEAATVVDPPPPAPTSTTVNGNASSKEQIQVEVDEIEDSRGQSMGLEPSAAGDRMEIDSPNLAVDSTMPGKTSSTTELADVGIDEDPATVDAILDVIKNMGVDQTMVTDMELTAAEQQLLHEAAAAVMDEPVVQNHLNGFVSPAVPAASPTKVDKEAEVEQRLTEVRNRQQAIESRCQSLLKRAGRLQSRHVGRHVADEVAHFVAYAKENLSLGGKGRPGHHGANGANLYGWAEDGRLPTREEVRNIPTATLVNLVSRLQAPPVSYLSNRRYFGLPGKSIANQNHQQQFHHHYHQNNHHSQKTGPQLTSQVAENLEEVAGLWEAQLRYLQRHDDPDATESSSGGESDEETMEPALPPTPIFEASSNSEQASSVTPSATMGLSSSVSSSGPNEQPAMKPVSTYQRAAWRWARDRAAVAARWSWLQAQVSDLEYRIRQHTDVYRQLRAAKGAVHFASPNGVPTPSTSSSTSSPVKSTDGLVLNDENDPNSDASSSRTRPLVAGPQTPGGNSQPASFRHRRLIRASQVQSSRKSSRHSNSSVRCCCVMSRIYNPCVLCNGKNNYLLPVDPDGMTIRERVGLTDRGFHPVLSLAQDIPLGAHVDSLLKSGDWRPTPAAANPAAMGSSSSGTSRAGLSSRRSKLTSQDDDTGSVTSGHSAKRKASANGTNKRKKTGEEIGEGAGSLKERRKSLTKRRRKHLISSEVLDDDSQSYPSSPFGDGSGSVPSTPGRIGGLPSRGSILQDMVRRRTSYDIDNIVIPYSMAATTRVERLQYKEIQTPKWRIIDGVEPISNADENATGETDEDVTEDACQARHDRSEVEERKKFMSYLKQPAGVTRGRRRVDQIDRMDSRADHSSGANTPDPMSPSCHLTSGSKTTDNDAADGEESILNPPMTTGELEAPPLMTPTTAAALAAASVKERRRTASLTKRDSVSRFIQDDNSGMSWDVDELIRNVAPYEPRQFPLPDAVYQQLLEEMPLSDAEEELIGGIVIEARPAVIKREIRSSESGGAGGPAGTITSHVNQTAGATPTTTASSVADDEAATFMSESSGSPAPEDLEGDEDDPDWEASSQSSLTRTLAKTRR